MADKKLYEKLLDAPLVIRSFVNDEPKCNYERYLTELINGSELFMRKSKGKPFRWVEHQDHGENDAVSNDYSVDFKLLATRSTLQGLRETDGQITKLDDGVIAFGIGRWQQSEQFKSIRTIAALRRHSVEDFNRIAVVQNGKVETEVAIILKSLRTKKNLLLFYPYILLFSEPCSFSEGCYSITEAVNEDLNNICAYRRNEAPGFDTFLCTIYDQKMLFFEDNGGWKLEDFVEMSSSKIYMDLYYDYGNSGFNF